MLKSEDKFESKQEEYQNKALEKESHFETRRLQIEKNLEKERRKLEWKKAKILTKERLNEERIKFIKDEDFTVKKIQHELTI